MSALVLEADSVLARDVSMTEDSMVVTLADGRTLSVPLGWFPRLLHASAEERNHWRLIGGGEGIHWPDIDEDISVSSLVAGHASSESAYSLQSWLRSRK